MVGSNQPGVGHDYTQDRSSPLRDAGRAWLGGGLYDTMAEIFAPRWLLAFVFSLQFCDVRCSKVGSEAALGELPLSCLGLTLNGHSGHGLALVGRLVWMRLLCW